jgi:hypothetical protein
MVGDANRTGRSQSPDSGKSEHTPDGQPMLGIDVWETPALEPEPKVQQQKCSG